MIRKLERRVIGTDYGCGGASFSEVIDKVNEVIDFINSHRSRPKSSDNWKPSEDEERLINTAISFLKDFADKGYENAVECIDWLKSKLNGNSGK